MVPRLSGGSLTPWLSESRVDSPSGPLPVWEAPASQADMYVRIGTRFSRRSGHVFQEDLIKQSSSYWIRSRAECHPRLRAGGRRTRPPVRARNTTTIGTIAAAPAITRSMLGLCSAPCKALRVASTALTRGLRALTGPARRPSWHYAMAGSVMTLPERIAIKKDAF